MPFTIIRFVLAASLAASCLMLPAQKRWAGKPGSWDNALNWQPAGLPDSTDQVVLDNSLQTEGYIVTLPDHAVAVNSLTIAPGTGKQIELLLPASNSSSPAFTANAIVVKGGGTFRNSSGLSSGQSIDIKGLLRLESGAAYVHNTRSGHAADVVAKLDTAAGTGGGTVEFDVPGGSYPLSLSNRVYGKLVLSSRASGGTQTYNASGTSPLLVRGDLVIHDGVILNIDFTKDFTIRGNYLQEGGVFNVASQPNANVINMQGDVSQLAGGVITETSAGAPAIEFNGSAQQQVSLAGSVANQVLLRVNNASGIYLLHDVTVPFALQLQQGSIITSRTALLIIPPNSRITGASAQSFVDGPVKKIGEEAFEFPVGRQGDYAPVALSAGTAATEEYTAEYFLGNPQTVYGALSDPSIIRVSALEYWRVEKITGASARKLTLSVGTYSHATAIDKLVVSRWDSTRTSWTNAGNSAYSGVATGKITSNSVTGFGAFTLASTEEDRNPLLPVEVHHRPTLTNTVLASFEIKQVRWLYNGVFISVVSTQKQLLQVTITGMDGRNIYQGKIELLEGNNLIRCALPGLSKGVYILQVSGGKGRIRVRRVCL